jgi:hypothetical protein
LLLLLSIGCCSSCLTTTPCFTSLLLIVLQCCSLCFTIAQCFYLLLLLQCCFILHFYLCFIVAPILLLLLFHYRVVRHCSFTLHYFPALPGTFMPLVALLFFYVLLLLNVSLLLCSNWYFAPPPPRHPPFFTRFWKFEFEINWEEARKHPSSKLPISFLCFLFSKLFFWFPFLDLVLGFYLLLFC